MSTTVLRTITHRIGGREVAGSSGRFLTWMFTPRLIPTPERSSMRGRVRGSVFCASPFQLTASKRRHIRLTCAVISTGSIPTATPADPPSWNIDPDPANEFVFATTVESHAWVSLRLRSPVLPHANNAANRTPLAAQTNSAGCSRTTPARRRLSLAREKRLLSL